MAPVPMPESSQNVPPLPAILPPTDPALRELVVQAERASARGDRGAARATLERALKIQPADAQLWLRLGELNFEEGEFEQAVVMGQRAGELAHGDAALQAQADALVARAQRRLTH
jgi:tetratricopeptide (TPR) repeat protein